MSERPIHDRLEELFVVDAIGGLDDDGRREMHELLTWHDSQCAECARFRREYGEVAASMALALDPVPLSAGAEERLLTATRTTAQGRPGRATGSGRVIDLDDVREERERRRSPARVAIALLTAAACLVGAGVLGYWLRGSSTSPHEIVAAYAAQGPTRSATMQNGSTKVTVYYHPGQGPALLVGTGMDDPPAGNVYELWYLPQGQTDMAPGGVFTPRDGEVVAPATVTAPFTTLAVSIEPGYRTSPTGKVVLSTTPGS